MRSSIQIGWCVYYNLSHFILCLLSAECWIILHSPCSKQNLQTFPICTSQTNTVTSTLKERGVNKGKNLSEINRSYAVSLMWKNYLLQGIWLSLPNFINWVGICSEWWQYMITSQHTYKSSSKYTIQNMRNKTKTHRQYWKNTTYIQIY